MPPPDPETTTLTDAELATAQRLDARLSTQIQSVITLISTLEAEISTTKSLILVCENVLLSDAGDAQRADAVQRAYAAMLTWHAQEEKLEALTKDWPKGSVEGSDDLYNADERALLLVLSLVEWAKAVQGGGSEFKGLGKEMLRVVEPCAGYMLRDEKYERVKGELVRKGGGAKGKKGVKAGVKNLVEYLDESFRKACEEDEDGGTSGQEDEDGEKVVKKDEKAFV